MQILDPTGTINSIPSVPIISSLSCAHIPLCPPSSQLQVQQNCHMQLPSSSELLLSSQLHCQTASFQKILGVRPWQKKQSIYLLINLIQLNILLNFLSFITLCIHMYVDRYACATEDKFQELFLFFHHMSPWDRTQVIRTGGTHLYIPSHLDSQSKYLYWGQVQWYTPLIPTLGRQRQADL